MSNYTHRTAPPNNQDIWDGVVFLIVLFNQSPDESLSYQTLQKALVKITANYQIILFDNTPKQSSYYTQDNRIIFCSNGENSGLPIAYNFAAKQALTDKRKYLVIFDQDSVVTTQYIHTVWQELAKMTTNDAVLVPNIVCGVYMSGLRLNIFTHFTISFSHDLSDFHHVEVWHFSYLFILFNFFHFVRKEDV